MLFLENLVRALLIFNGLRSRYWQRALLVYHYHNNTASGLDAAVSGGSANTASGGAAAVSGGRDRQAPGERNWAAGAFFSTH
jgi:hypothetical protein